MKNGFCDVNGCANPVFMGWRPLTERLGRKVCQYHWRRHKDQQDSFDLFEAFGFVRPAGLEKPAAKPLDEKHVPRCACGQELLRGRTFCTPCAQERERERKKQYYHERKSRQEEKPAEPADIRPCRDCGQPREAGHMYCPNCAQKRQKQSNRQRRRRCYQKTQKCVGLM